MSGCIHIYCGDGKGKTTAALGLAIRAAGRGRKVFIARFLKNDDSGELPVLKNVPGITILPCDRAFGFVFRMNERERQEASDYFHHHFLLALQQVQEGAYDMLILDEMMAACSYGMISEVEILDFLQKKPESLEVVMTGRNPSDKLMAVADYITEMRMIKHPLEKGIPAREGIEY